MAQGALGIEYRIEDTEIQDILAFLHDEMTARQVKAERGFLTGLDGGCQVPIAAWSQLDGDQVKLTGFVADIDGSSPIRMEKTGPCR